MNMKEYAENAKRWRAVAEAMIHGVDDSDERKAIATHIIALMDIIAEDHDNYIGDRVIVCLEVLSLAVAMGAEHFMFVGCVQAQIAIHEYHQALSRGMLSIKKDRLTFFIPGTETNDMQAVAKMDSVLKNMFVGDKDQ